MQMASYKDFITLLQNHKILIVTLAAISITTLTDNHGIIK